MRLFRAGYYMTSGMFHRRNTSPFRYSKPTSRKKPAGKGDLNVVEYYAWQRILLAQKTPPPNAILDCLSSVPYG
jgi:hypothetical protein